MKKIRIGMVGTGFISHYHYQGFRNIKNADIVGMCTHSNMEKLKSMCDEWGIKAYKGFDEMVEDPDIDALILGSVTSEHYEQIIKAAEKGKHLLVEKPVVTDFAQLDRIDAVLREKGVLLFPAHNFVYRDALTEAKKIMESGALGRITYAAFISTHIISQDHSTGWRTQNGLSGGGALMDSGHHQVYMSLYLMGMPQKIQAFKSNLVLKKMEDEDIAQINMLYPDGTIGCIMQSWTSQFGSGINGIKIVGDKGEISITDGLYHNGSKIPAGVDYAESFANQSQAFTDYIINGTKPLSDLRDVRNTLKIINGAYLSCKEERVVDLSHY